ncbi:hypothetical protein [Spirosoma montaniterrae]|nr:hypothetical protein [Spirosoma montaniterrae]
MTISTASRSLYRGLLALLVVGTLTTACKKSGGSDDVDPRDQYVGTYEGGIASSLNVGGFEGTSQTGTSTIIITKGSNPKEILIDTQMSLGRPTPLKVTAELEGSTFRVIDRNKDQMNVLGVTVEGEFKATGVLEKNQVAITATTEGLRTGAVVKRTEQISGTKK